MESLKNFILFDASISNNKTVLNWYLSVCKPIMCVEKMLRKLNCKSLSIRRFTTCHLADAEWREETILF